MRIKPNYILIPLVTVIVALLGSFFTEMGMDWYNQTLVRPELTPPRWVFPVVWNGIFILTTASALIVWNKEKRDIKFLWFRFKRTPDAKFWVIISLFALNAVLNVLWSLLFFGMREICAAFTEMVILEVTILLLIALIWRISKIASLALLPYALWVGFATYLTYLIASLNL
ncbi:tryptophan-rich sensory protein [Candidatus Peregrinibacteria bacterium]|nr:tryptophan-rich sensory protein [Candidatus Peregrinibacteria bacterium]